MRRDKELTIEITKQCPIECKWCSTSATIEGEHVPLERIFVMMRQFKPYCNVLRISGGEPLMHPQIHEILYEAKKFLDYKIILLTNGQTTLGATSRDLVDEFVVSIVNGHSFSAAKWYKQDKRKVSLHVVAVDGNEGNMLDALNFAFEQDIPIHLLTLQKQGRGANCEPSHLITWTGMKGCTQNKKVTVSADGSIVTCSAFKFKGKCDAKT